MAEVSNDAFPSNSHEYNSYSDREKDTSEKVVIKRVDQDEVVIRKPSFFSKCGHFIADCFQCSTQDILIPAARKLFYDFFDTMSRRAILGDDRGRRRSRYSYYDDYYYDRDRYYDYAAEYSNRRRDSDTDTRRLKINKNSLPEIIFRSEETANNYIKTLEDALEEYGTITVANAYDSAGRTVDFIWERYGWINKRGYNFEGAVVVPIKEGWLVDLPDFTRVDR